MAKKEKKDYTKEKAVFGVILLLVALFAVIEYSLKENEILEEPTNDFTSTEAGTLDGWIQTEGFPTEGTIILFSSSKIPGLAIVYYPFEKRILAGLPPMIGESVDLIDGKNHHIIYSFEEGGQQALFIDEKVVASGNYQSYQNQMTGMVIGAIEPSNQFEEVKIE